MKQLLQHLKTGEMEVAELPCPRAGRGQLLIQTRTSLISPGTERLVVEFSQANLLQKARQQPEKVKQVLDKIKTDGLLPTLETVFRRLDEPMPLGYSNTGVVMETGDGVHEFRPGDRVVSNGPHAEVVCVPRNLCAKIPDGVSDDQAAFTVLGSIALQGVRLAMPTLGEKFMVFGMGLVGLLSVQMLKAAGCQVLAIDLNPARLKLAETFGARTVDVSKGADPVAAAQAWTLGKGVDGVLLCANAPKNDDIIHQSAESCRKRGRIILIGKVGLQLRHADFYEKEISLQLSASYGPGRYDEKYEQAGQDYPFAFVRWTEHRNFEAVLHILQSGQLQVENFITDRIALNDAKLAYDKIFEATETLAILLQYPREVMTAPRVAITQTTSAAAGGPVIGIIGAGIFANSVLLPAISQTRSHLAYIASRGGASARQAANKYQIAESVTDYRIILDDPKVELVFILLRHDMHARLVREALDAGKHVFVEKPLALTAAELSQIEEVVKDHPAQQLAVGFNRRFSPHIVKARELLRGRGEPLCMNMTVNAGTLPPDSWHQDREVGGGRIIGEGCHFIDLLAHLADSPVASVSAAMVGDRCATRDDKMSILLRFKDGSVGTVNYFANGSKSYPKEMLEIFSDGRVLAINNFRTTEGYSFQGFKRFKTSRQNKGHHAELNALVDRVRSGGPPLMPFEQIRNVSLASICAFDSAQRGSVIEI